MEKDDRRFCEYAVVITTVSGREYHGNHRKYEIGGVTRDNSFDKDRLAVANVFHREGSYALNMLDGTTRRFNIRNIEWIELRLVKSAVDV